jgi:hypothetical protein
MTGFDPGDISLVFCHCATGEHKCYIIKSFKTLSVRNLSDKTICQMNVLRALKSCKHKNKDAAKMS